MNRRGFLKALLATPVVAAFAPVIGRAVAEVYRAHAPVAYDFVADPDLGFWRIGAHDSFGFAVKPRWTSVRAFGAFGDGLHDDTDAIQMAVDYAAGGPVLVEPGTYAIRGPIDFKSSPFVGAGSAITLVKATDRNAGR
jgi:hypothetical protein